MSYLKLYKSGSLVATNKAEIVFDIFKAFMPPLEFSIFLESLGYEKPKELVEREDVRFYSCMYDEKACVFVAIGQENPDCYLFSIEEKEKPFSEKNMFYWCGLYLDETYKIGKNKQTYHRVLWEDEFDSGQSEELTFKDAVKSAMLQQMKITLD